MPNTGGDTDTVLGAWAIRCRTDSRSGSFAGAEAALPSGKVTSTRTGPSAPGPSASAAAFTPPRISCVGSNCRCMLLPSTIENAGAARASNSAAAASADTHGRRITRPVQRDQNRDWVASGRRDQCRYDDRFAAARPNAASTAGVNVVEVSTAMATARMAPVAIDCSTGVLIRYRPVTEAITVIPDSTTARPEVAIAASAASAGSRPARSSSRNRMRMNRE